VAKSNTTSGGKQIRGKYIMWLFLIFVAVPIIEIALFIQVGGVLGLFPTLAIVILTALAGTMLMRRQGLATLARLQQSLESAGNPAGHLAHGALILVAGVLLLTPGFFTDALGLAFLVPQVRTALVRWGAARLATRATVWTSRSRPADSAATTTTVEGDFEIVEDDTDEARPGHSGWTRPQ